MLTGQTGLAVTLYAEHMKPNLHESDIQPSLLRRSPDIGYRGEGRKPWRRQARSAFTLIELLACQPKPWRRQVRSAFTLIELLVVIAITSALAALLLPTLNQAKNRALIVVDLNHYHQILLATHMYCADNNDIMPRPGWLLGMFTMVPTTWCNGGSLGFPLAAPPLTDATYPAAYAAQADCYKGTPKHKAAQLYPYLKNLKVLRCPADIPSVNMYKRGVLLTSYNWNPAVVGYYLGPSPPVYKLKQFKADAILLWENDETEDFWDDTSEYPDENVSTRHGHGIIVVGLFGGGAQAMKLTDFYWQAAHQRTRWPGPWGAGWLQFPGHVGLPNQLWCNPRHPYGAHD
jgi:prepilin-type N-terminal cleavage/methylation domain-containing protein